MIFTKVELKRVLEEDKKMMHKDRYAGLFSLDLVWKYEIILRKHEYHHNANHFFRRKFYGFLHVYYGVKLGFTIPINVCGAGLRLEHSGLIIINENAKIGERCCIHQGVNIGVDDSGKAPVIGDYVWIGPGAKLYGDIYVADNINIGANAVVNKSFNERSCTIAGVPAKVVSNKWNNDWYFKWKAEKEGDISSLGVNENEKSN